MFSFQHAVSMFRLSEGLCREDWSWDEIQNISSDADLKRHLGQIEEQLWFPKPMDLFRYLHDRDLPQDLGQDILFHLETLGCARSARLLQALLLDSGRKRLLDLPQARQMNILGHLAFSKTWMIPLAPQAKYSPEKSLPLKQSQGDDSHSIILGNFPIRVKRSMRSHGEKTTLIFPGRTYPFPKVKVLALDEHFQILMEEELPLDPGARSWSARFKSPTARRYLLAVRPLDPSEIPLENPPHHSP